MGTICAPSYANIFIDHFENLMKFLNELNTKHESIKFEYQISKTSITFLDTEVYIENNKLYTKIYKIKKTDCQTFLRINKDRYSI